MTNRSCNLECVEDDGGDIVEFVGPVKIILVNQPRKLYVRKRCAAALLVMAHIAMGAAVIIVLFYVLHYSKRSGLKGMHIFLGTMGLQVCMPLAILSLHQLAGSTVPVKLPDRKKEHLTFHLMSILFTILSGVAAYYAGYFRYTLHSMLGCGSAAGSGMNSILGLFVYFLNKDIIDPAQKGILNKLITKVHQLFGITAFVAASSCFVTGLLKGTFLLWAELPEVMPFTVFFCVFYTTVISYKPLKEIFLVWYTCVLFSLSGQTLICETNNIS